MITKFKKLISMIMKNNDRNNATIFSLAPKIPNTKKGYNIYEKYLKRAFKDPAIKNIAVTGNFGIGKSSFIKWFSRRKKYLFVSLCNFKSNNDSEINSLEFNLVQQLIIGCKSANRNKKRVGFIAFAMTFVFNILLAYFLISTNFMGILDFINNLIVNADMESVFDKAEKNFYIIIALIYFLGLPILFSNIISHISLKKLSFKTAEIEAELEVRNNQKFSFMDFHRAEVVAILKYYSEKYDYTVVFEDMDRLSFEMCVTVFAELREINRLVNMFPAKLNVAKKTIRFIYVIHDGVFETIGGTSANNTSTQSNNPILNHLKFFDYILPFIPLILNEAASNYFNGCLDEIGFDYSGEFLEIVGKYIYDYRSIHNIINEYCVMRDVYIDDEENEFNTQDQKQLMALAVYKTLMPNDYQKIRIGESIIQKGSNSSNECINRLILNNWLCVECLKYIGLSETEIKKYINGLFKKTWRSERWPVLQNILNSRYDICNEVLNNSSEIPADVYKGILVNFGYSLLVLEIQCSKPEYDILSTMLKMTTEELKITETIMQEQRNIFCKAFENVPNDCTFVVFEYLLRYSDCFALFFKGISDEIWMNIFSLWVRNTHRDFKRYLILSGFLQWFNNAARVDDQFNRLCNILHGHDDYIRELLTFNELSSYVKESLQNLIQNKS